MSDIKKDKLEENRIETGEKKTASADGKKSAKKRDSIKRQKIAIAAAAGVAALLAVLYFAVLRPMLDVRTTAEYTLIDGEGVNIAKCEVLEVTGDGKVTYSDEAGTVAYCTGGSVTIKVDNTDALATAGRYYMFPTIKSENVARLEITNESGTFGFYYDKDHGNYYIIDHPGTPYDSTLFSLTMAAARNPMAIRRITEHADDLSKYGLAPENDPAKYTVTSKDGRSHTVLVGSIIVTGGGYYCTVEGSSAVYILDADMGKFFLRAEDFVTPLIAYPLSENDYYYTSEFTLSVDGKVFVSCGFMTDEERAKTASTSTYKMNYPENYVPSTDNYGEILRTFIGLEGESTLAFGPVLGEMPEETLAQYGLDKPKYEVYYRYGNINNFTYFSEKNEDGSYYAYSMIFNIISKIDGEKVKFLDYQFIDFVDKPLFQKNINDVASIRIEAEGVDESFIITGDSQDTLAVKAQSTGEIFDAATLRNFRNLYRKLLGLTIEEYAPEPNTDQWIMRLTVVTDVGLEYKYDFYAYSTRRCYFTINGVGEFYCLRDRVEQIIKDVGTLMNGGNIDVTNFG